MAEKESVQTKVEKESNNQDQGKMAGCGHLGYIKRGPAASHDAGNPTSSGGINRPAKGKP